jgi:hypothetical protein
LVLSESGFIILGQFVSWSKTRELATKIVKFTVEKDLIFYQELQVLTPRDTEEASSPQQRAVT